MGIIYFLGAVFIIFVGGGWLLGGAIGNLLFPSEKEKGITFIDKSVHNHVHHHDNRSINIIDETTKKEIMKLKDK